MAFNRDVELDTSQIEDARGSGGGGGGLGGRVAVGGGGVSIVGVILYLIMSQLGGGGGGGSLPDLTQLGSGFGSVQSGQDVDNTQLAQNCRTTNDADTREDCEAVAVVNSVQAFWAGKLGSRYHTAPTKFFEGQVETSGCGGATSASGPFYCPADSKVYIDLAFYRELETTFGAENSWFARAYVLAHEYGHHVQNLMGTSDKARSMAASGPTSGSVRLELQADCYAGVWANHASTVPTKSGNTLIDTITKEDVSAALDTAARIGDDNIQSEIAHQQVDESSFTHGSSAQRKRWFTRGLSTGDTKQCDTFSRAVNLG